MRRVCIWCLLTEKRLLKKISYIAVLMILPVLMLGLRRASKEEAGMVSIGLCTEDGTGSLSDQIIQRMMEEGGILKYKRYETEAMAMKAVRAGEVDAAWIFPQDLEKDLEKLAAQKRVSPVVRVVEREDSVALVFTREVLCSRIFPEFAYETYRDFVRDHVGEDFLTEEELKAYYQERLMEGSLFQAEYLDGSVGEEENYFLAPVKGILAIWLVLAGFAALLYHLMDERNGVYDGVPRKRRLLYSFGLQGVVLLNGGIVYILACMALRVFANPLREVPLLLLFLTCIACFCNVMGLLIRKIEGIGVLIPVFVLLMVAFCPIFLNIRKFWMVQSLLPPYLYLKALHGNAYVLPMACYALGGFGLCALINGIKYRR